MLLSSGTIVASTFELLRPLGGRVWLARDKILQREVALKFQKDGADGRAALLAEAAILARCDHPGIVQFYRTYASAPPEPAFYAMKAYPFTLRDLPGGRDEARPSHSINPFNPSTLQPFNPSTLQPFNSAAEAVASALACLHALSPPVAHGDVNLENILFDDDGHAVLAGFGRARSCVGDDASALADDIRALGILLRDAWDGHPSRFLRPLLARMLAEDPSTAPSAAEVAVALSHSPRSRWRRTAAAIVAIAILALFFSPHPADEAEDAVVAEAEKFLK